MGDLNKVCLIGRLAKDPTVVETPDGKHMCHLDVATSYGTQRDGKFDRETVHHTVHVYGKQAVSCATLTKNRLVYVEGELTPAKEVRATNVYFLGDKPSEKEQA